MRARSRTARGAVLAISLFAAGLTARADEGMWTFDNPPVAAVQQRYGVTLTPEWLARLQKASVKYGASASFVSGQGLLLTNHHVALGCIERLSRPGRDLASRGYVARSRSAELRCPGDTARVLQGTEDVSAAVQQAMAAGSTDEQRNALRKARIAEIEKRCEGAGQPGAGKPRCEVVKLYSGSVHHLYRYRQWDDVRLVFAPEYQAAFYGGDPDNFVFPRYAFDFALMRVYENGRPAATPDHLKLASAPLAEGDVVFVAGHPGQTDRLQTLAQLKFQRDVELPLDLASAGEQRQLLQAYSARSPEAARQALDRLFGTENWLKAMRGEYAALSAPALMAAKEADEARFRAAYAARGLPGDPWADVEAATARHAAKAKELKAIGYGYKTLFSVAGDLVELAYERRLPEGERLAKFRDAALPEIERRVLAEVPYYKDLEVARLAGKLSEARAMLGDEHAWVKATLAGATPQAAAERALRTSRLDELAVRRALLAGGAAAVEASDDPLIRLALAAYPLRREVARYREEKIDTPIEQAAERLGQARFALYGRDVPPDATGTLRLSYGKVAGYDANGVATPWKTTIGGLVARADAFDGKAPFDLSPAVAKARSHIDPQVPLNLATTADIIGGNSGSPLVNRRGEWVGLMFDSNLEALGGRYVYTDDKARSLAVHAQAIVHALEKVYAAPQVVRELRGTAARPRRH